MKLKYLLILFASSLSLLACSGGDETAPVGEDPPSLEATLELEPIAAPPPELVAKMLEPFHGDFAAMVERRTIKG